MKSNQKLMTFNQNESSNVFLGMNEEVVDEKEDLNNKESKNDEWRNEDVEAVDDDTMNINEQCKKSSGNTQRKEHCVYEHEKGIPFNNSGSKEETLNKSGDDISHGTINAGESAFHVERSIVSHTNGEGNRGDLYGSESGSWQDDANGMESHLNEQQRNTPQHSSIGIDKGFNNEGRSVTPDSAEKKELDFCEQQNDIRLEVMPGDFNAKATDVDEEVMPGDFNAKATDVDEEVMPGDFNAKATDVDEEVMPGDFNAKATDVDEETSSQISANADLSQLSYRATSPNASPLPEELRITRGEANLCEHASSITPPILDIGVTEPIPASGTPEKDEQASVQSARSDCSTKILSTASLCDNGHTGTRSSEHGNGVSALDQNVSKDE